MAIKKTLATILLSATASFGSAQTTSEVYIAKAKEYEAIATVYKESAEIAANAVMKLENIDIEQSLKERSDKTEATDTEKIAKFQRQKYIDYLEVSSSLLIALDCYKKAGSRELIDRTWKEANTYYGLALKALSSSEESYSLSSAYFDKVKDPIKAIEMKREQAKTLKTLTETPKEIPKRITLPLESIK
jgi:hypothetical protein